MKATIFDQNGERAYSPADAAELGADTPYAWLDLRVDDFDDPELTTLLTQLGLSSLVMTYLKHKDTGGMFQIVQDSLIGLTWAAADNDGDIPVAVHFLWDSSRFLTIRTGADQAIQYVYDEVGSQAAPLFSHPTVVPGVVLQLILASIGRRLTHIGTQLAVLDNAIIEDVQTSQLADLRAIRAEVSPLLVRLPSYSDTISAIMVDPSTLPGMDQQGADHLQSYAAHVKSTVAALSDVGDDIRNAAQDYQTEIGNLQSNRINQLTIVSILFLPVTFLTGYFGMNFNWLDNNLQSLWSWVVLGVGLPLGTVALSAIVLSRHGFQLGLRKRRRKSHRDAHQHVAKAHPAQPATALPQPPQADGIPATAGQPAQQVPPKS